MDIPNNYTKSFVFTLLISMVLDFFGIEKLYNQSIRIRIFKLFVDDLNEKFSEPINLICSERRPTKSFIPLTMIGGEDGGGLTGSIFSFEASIVECFGGFKISILSLTVRQEYLFDIENIIFCNVFAILFKVGASDDDDDRFLHSVFLEQVSGSKFISEFLNTLSLDTLCIQLDDAEFGLFLFVFFLELFALL